MTIDLLKDVESVVSLCTAGLFLIALIVSLLSRSANGLKIYLILTTFFSLLFFVASSYSILIGNVLTSPFTIYFVAARLVSMILMVISIFLSGIKVLRLKNE